MVACKSFIRSSWWRLCIVITLIFRTDDWQWRSSGVCIVIFSQFSRLELLFDCMHSCSMSLAIVVCAVDTSLAIWLKDLFRNVDAPSLTGTLSYTMGYVYICISKADEFHHMISLQYSNFSYSCTDRLRHIRCSLYLLSDTKSSWQQNPIR